MSALTCTCPLGRCDQCGAGNPTGFTCGADQRHVNCSACYRPFAVRTDDPAVKQQCEICQRYFCQFYGGNCRSANAPQRFRKLKEHEFAQLPIIWPGCFRGNTYERTGAFHCARFPPHPPLGAHTDARRVVRGSLARLFDQQKHRGDRLLSDVY